MNSVEKITLSSHYLCNFDRDKDLAGRCIAEALRSHQAVNMDEALLSHMLWQAETEDQSPLKSIKSMSQRAAVNLVNSIYGAKKTAWPHAACLHHWKEFQLAEALSALNLYLENRGKITIYPTQLENGAAPLESGGHWQWANLPLQRYHSFLGVLWFVLGLMADDQRLQSAAEKLAQWQLNTLDSKFMPMVGLLTQEEDAVATEILCWNALLFYAVGAIAHDSSMTYAAERQYAHLDDLLKQRKKSIPPLAAAIECWLQGHIEECTSQAYCPNGSYCDETTAFVAQRSDEWSVACCGYGGRTGMGSLIYEDLEIVAYGPQHLPYFDCKGFGIQATPQSQKKIPNFDISQREEGFTLNATAKLPGTIVHASPYALYRNSNHSEIWVDMMQDFNRGTLNIGTLFLGLEDFKSLSFVFYVKGNKCLVGREKIVNSRSLDRFKGKVQRLELGGEKSKIVIIPKYEHGLMEIIPLAGDDSFWGADFLIGYTVSKMHPKYHWMIYLEKFL